MGNCILYYNSQYSEPRARARVLYRNPGSRSCTGRYENIVLYYGRRCRRVYIIIYIKKKYDYCSNPVRGRRRNTRVTNAKVFRGRRPNPRRRRCTTYTLLYYEMSSRVLAHVHLRARRRRIIFIRIISFFFFFLSPLLYCRVSRYTPFLRRSRYCSDYRIRFFFLSFFVCIYNNIIIFFPRVVCMYIYFSLFVPSRVPSRNSLRARLCAQYTYVYCSVCASSTLYFRIRTRHKPRASLAAACSARLGGL